MVSLKKKHFFGKLHTGCLYFKKSRSNFFITLTDLNAKVIICLSSGSVLSNVSKKRKKSPQAIEDIMRVLRSYFITYKINNVIIILRQRISIFIRFIIKELEIFNIPILHFRFKLSIAFNGMRKRKLRRL